jgi:hypothetical protein
MAVAIMHCQLCVGSCENFPVLHERGKKVGTLKFKQRKRKRKKINYTIRVNFPVSFVSMASSQFSTVSTINFPS